jgi:hypothetical protein
MKKDVCGKRMPGCLGALLVLLCFGCSQEGPARDSSGAPGQAVEARAAEVIEEAGEKISVTIFPRKPGRNVSLQAKVRGADLVEEWRWYRNDDLIPVAAGSVLPGRNGVRGDLITVVVRAGGREITDSVAIVNSPPEVTRVGLESNQIFRGRDIVALPESVDIDDDLVDFHYLWFIDGEPAQDQTSDTLPGDQFRKGNTVALKVIPFDGQAEGSPFISDVITIPNGPPRFLSQPPKQFTGLEYRYQIQAEDPDEDRLSFSLERGPEGMVIDPETGLLLWPLSGTSMGEVEVSISVTDEEGLWARQEFTIQLAPLERQTHD